MAKRPKSSKSWLAEHHADVYVQKARKAGWRSRAVFKLSEIDEREHLVRPGLTVVDLGAAPGAWSQYVTKILDGRGRIIALDLLAMDPLPDVDVIQGDFREASVLARVQSALGGREVDLVISDLAPNISGMKAVDQPRAMYLAELALEFCQQHLRVGGSFVTKLFHGEGFDTYVRSTRDLFESVRMRKPAASRPRSRETYLVAKKRRA